MCVALLLSFSLSGACCWRVIFGFQFSACVVAAFSVGSMLWFFVLKDVVWVSANSSLVFSSYRMSLYCLGEV